MKQILQFRPDQQIRSNFSFLISVLPLEGVSGLKSKKKILLSLPIIAFLLSLSINASAQVSGTVYQDLPVNGTALNTYGVKDANELGVEGVTVTVFPGGATTTTAANGTYSFLVADAPVGDIRVEFTWPTKTWLQSSPDAAMQNTSVQFVTAPSSNVDFGLHSPSDFSDDSNPHVATPRYYSGDPLAAGGGANNAGIQSGFVGYRYHSSGTTLADHIETIALSEIGTTYGVGFDRVNQRLYTGALARRHAGFGPSGVAAIYVLDYSNKTNPSVMGAIDLSSLIPTTPDPRDGTALNSLSADMTTPSADGNMFNLVGRMAFGDVEVSPDGNTLWVMNLTDKTLYEIDISNYPASPIGAGNITAHNTGIDPGCNSGDFVPWAIEIYHDEVYVGVVCTAETSGMQSDLTANVMKLGGAGFTSVFSMSLDFPRGCHDGGGFSGGLNTCEWYPWVSAWNQLIINPFDATIINRVSTPQPILNDIEFDIDGSMALGFLSRDAMQGGYLNFDVDGNNAPGGFGFVFISGGDLIRVHNNNGVFVLENDATAGANTTAGVGNAQGPGGGEYYFEDQFAGHQETFLGSLGFLPGSGTTLSQLYDAFGFYTNGAVLVSNTDGTIESTYQIVQSQAPGTFGKTMGIGDLELLVSPAPIEIGNFVWDDTNSNGEQDPGEAGLAGVMVELLNAGGMVITSALTDANGNYIFSSDPNGMSTTSHIYNITTLNPNTAYTLRVPTTNGANNLTTANGAGGKDIIDSDANTGTGEATVLATDIPVLGANNHTFDFGYSGLIPCPPARCGTITGVKN